MEVFWVGPGLAPGNGPTLMLDGVELPLKDNVHSLGALLDLALRLDRQVVTVAFYHVQPVHQL